MRPRGEAGTSPEPAEAAGGEAEAAFAPRRRSDMAGRKWYASTLHKPPFRFEQGFNYDGCIIIV